MYPSCPDVQAPKSPRACVDRPDALGAGHGQRPPALWRQYQQAIPAKLADSRGGQHAEAAGITERRNRTRLSGDVRAGSATLRASRLRDAATVLIRPQRAAPSAQTVRPRLQWTVRAMKAQRRLQPVDVSDAAPRGQGPATQPRRLPPLPPCSSAKLQRRAKELRSRRKSPQPRLGWRLNKPAQWRISFSQYVAEPLTMYAPRPAAQAPKSPRGCAGMTVLLKATAHKLALIGAGNLVEVAAGSRQVRLFRSNLSRMALCITNASCFGSS